MIFPTSLCKKTHPVITTQLIHGPRLPCPPGGVSQASLHERLWPPASSPRLPVPSAQGVHGSAPARWCVRGPAAPFPSLGLSEQCIASALLVKDLT